MNVILLVVDSLRFDAVHAADLAFFRRLDKETTSFRRAYATECWTLPAHTSMFTGLLPSEHGAHFQTMGYSGASPTIAELCASAGLQTEVVTRNSIFDGTLPGITRGFHRNVRLASQRHALDPLSLMLAASKPRFRKQILSTGFFHPAQRQNRAFVMQFARSMLPADRRTLDYVIARADELRRQHHPFFLFANLYDVHAPYPPRENSMLDSFASLTGIIDNARMPIVMASLGGHTYLRPGFRLLDSSRRMIRRRYERAVALMDRKLEAFYDAARDARILDDTLLIITSDHGEAFGEHALYLHDASVYNTNLHVPLWVRHPQRPPEVVDDVVSTRDLFGLMRSAALGAYGGTILDSGYRREHPIALAEHFYYPHCPTMDAKYRQNQVAAIAHDTKVIARNEGVFTYDRAADPDEETPDMTDMSGIERTLRRSGYRGTTVTPVLDHLRQWRASGLTAVEPALS